MFYSQKDPRWAKEKLGNCTDTIARSGCKISCYAYFCQKTPSEVNCILKAKGGYVNGCLTVDSKDAEILGFEYIGRAKKPLDGEICIMETNHYSPKVPQHFVLYRDGEIVDPLDLNPKWKPNKYKAVSYRLFNEKQNVEELKCAADKLLEEKVTALQAEFNACSAEKEGDEKRIKELENENKELTERIEDLKAQVVEEQKAEEPDKKPQIRKDFEGTIWGLIDGLVVYLLTHFLGLSTEESMAAVVTLTPVLMRLTKRLIKGIQSK